MCVCVAAMPSVMERSGAGVLSRSRAKTVTNGNSQPHSEEDSSDEEHAHGTTHGNAPLAPCDFSRARFHSGVRESPRQVLRWQPQLRFSAPPLSSVFCSTPSSPSWAHRAPFLPPLWTLISPNTRIRTAPPPASWMQLAQPSIDPQLNSLFNPCQQCRRLRLYLHPHLLIS